MSHENLDSNILSWEAAADKYVYIIMHNLYILYPTTIEYCLMYT